MAWTYFTSDLNPGDSITKNQRDELLDALVERQHACGPSAFAFDASYLSEVKASPIITDKLLGLLHSGSATVIPRRAPAYLRAAATKYAPSVGGTLYTATSFLTAVAAELGISTGDLSALWNATVVVNSAVYWNSIRRGINLLQHCKGAWKSTVTSNAKTNSETTSEPWQDFATEVHGSAPSISEGTFPQFLSSAHKLAGPERRLATLVSADALASSITERSGTLHLFVAATHHADGLPEQEGIVLLNSTDSDSVFLTSIESGQSPTIFNQLSIDYNAPDGSGVPATLRLQSWSDLGTFLAYQPLDEEGGEEYFQAQIEIYADNVWLSPNFTHF